MDPNQNQNPMADNDGGIKTVGLFLWDLLKIFIVALIIIVPFRLFIAEPFVVSGSSMVPNFHNGDYLIVDRLSYRFAPPARGDAIVLKFPRDTAQFFIKRIIGLPGETIRLWQGHVLVSNKQNPQGFVLQEPYLPSQLQTLGRNEPTVLGSGEYFVLGDNRTASSDSRVWGILPAGDIVGRVWVRVFPLNAAAAFKTPAY